ncbi:methyl-accepting chemotaxis protein [Marispirochaeta aestuarii]|uniref:methyl-accepting chemotaxis protein n=1 Tax=Marispirochaeta aestuarii TaxID=1963862 RepID=UPI0029C68C8D|nr:methyl-accepting chemotaxis protein [Marispirochaeta aestuarii]
MKRKREMKLRTRLFLSFFALIIIAGIIGFSAMVGIDKVNGLMTDIYTYNLLPIRDLAQAKIQALYFSRSEYRMIIETEMDTMKNIAQNIEKYRAAVEQRIEKYRPAVQSSEEAALLADFEDLWIKHCKDYEHFLDLTLSNQNAEANVFMAEVLRPSFNAADDKLTELIDWNVSYAANENTQGDVITRRISIIMMVLMSVGAVVGVLLSLLIIRSITKSVGGEPGDIADLAERISNGDLNIEGNEKKDSTGIYKSLLNMSARLREIVVSVQMAVEYVASGSEQLSSASQQLSQGSSEQAASAEEISASMDESSASVQQNTENALTTEKISQQAATNAQLGEQEVNKAVEAVREIAGKIDIINEIARQTNLLALNAAIEAARAGEVGKGFAVVASEVRKLAERSQKAAGEITELATSTVDQAGNAGKLINKIVPDIQKTAELVQEIAASSQEQSSGIEQIGRAIEQLDLVIQQNASVSEETASTAEELSAQSQQLMDTMSFFRIDNSADAFSRRKSSEKRTAVKKDAFPSSPKLALPDAGESRKAAAGITLKSDESDQDFVEF